MKYKAKLLVVSLYRIYWKIHKLQVLPSFHRIREEAERGQDTVIILQ